MRRRAGAEAGSPLQRVELRDEAEVQPRPKVPSRARRSRPPRQRAEEHRQGTAHHEGAREPPRGVRGQDDQRGGPTFRPAEGRPLPLQAGEEAHAEEEEGSQARGGERGQEGVRQEAEADGWNRRRLREQPEVPPRQQAAVERGRVQLAPGPRQGVPPARRDLLRLRDRRRGALQERRRVQGGGQDRLSLGHDRPTGGHEEDSRKEAAGAHDAGRQRREVYRERERYGLRVRRRPRRRGTSPGGGGARAGGGARQREHSRHYVRQQDEEA